MIAQSLPSQTFRLDYGRELEEEIARLAAAFAEQGLDVGPYPPRWLALKLLENEQDIVDRVRRAPGGESLVRLGGERAAHLRAIYGDDVDIVVADRRYGFISGLARQAVRRPRLDRVTLTDRIDNVVTHRWLGLPIFLAVMYVMFRLVIDVAAPYLDWVDGVINGPLASWLTSLLTSLAAPDWLHSLAIDGVVAGVGGVLVFVPGLMVLYFFLALLENSGYLARAAFVMDRFMRVIGLHGKSFIPMILGFGCAVPAIYATRTLPSRRDRILTGLLVPLMSCSARLPVYIVFGLAFFGHDAGTVIWLLYAIGILIAVLAGMVFTRTLLKPDTTSAFVLELPPYRLPTLRGLLMHMWQHTREFVRRAGTLILAASVVLWVLLNVPWGVEDQRDSLFGRVSSIAAPLFEPLGFGTWESAGALATGFIAKEVVVSTTSQIYLGATQGITETATTTFGEDLRDIAIGFGAATVDAGKTLLSLIPGVDLAGAGELAEEDTALSTVLRGVFTPLAAFAFLVFVLLYVPCVATLSAVRQEFGGKWAIVSAVYQTSIAWVVAFVVYQGGRLVGIR